MRNLRRYNPFRRNPAKPSKILRKDSFDADIANLPIMEKAKQVLQNFVNSECEPTSELSPKQARTLRRDIIKTVELCAEKAWASGTGEVREDSVAAERGGVPGYLYAHYDYRRSASGGLERVVSRLGREPLDEARNRGKKVNTESLANELAVVSDNLWGGTGARLLWSPTEGGLVVGRNESRSEDRGGTARAHEEDKFSLLLDALADSFKDIADMTRRPRTPEPCRTCDGGGYTVKGPPFRSEQTLSNASPAIREDQEGIKITCSSCGGSGSEPAYSRSELRSWNSGRARRWRTEFHDVKRKNPLYRRNVDEDYRKAEREILIAQDPESLDRLNNLRLKLSMRPFLDLADFEEDRAENERRRRLAELDVALQAQLRASEARNQALWRIRERVRGLLDAGYSEDDLIRYLDEIQRRGRPRLVPPGPGFEGGSGWPVQPRP